MENANNNIFEMFTTQPETVKLADLVGSMIIGDVPQKNKKGVRKYSIQMLVSTIAEPVEVELTAKQNEDFARCEGKALVNADLTLTKLVKKKA